MHPIFARQWTFLNTLDQTLEILDRVRHPAVGMAFNVYHLWQEARLLDRIAEVAPRVATVQLSDWREPPRSDNDHCSLGAGCLPLDRMIEAFVMNGYRGYFDVEIWSEELWGQDYFDLLRDNLGYLRSLGRNERRHIPV